MNFKEFKSRYQKIAVEEYSNSVPDDIIVSVCVQTYQHEEFIRQCLDSILMQKTDFNFEILLGEDDSTDNTRKICIEYANKYPSKIRLFLHHRENNIYLNGKPSGRFNILYNFSSAKGRYVAICEGDDFWTDSLKLQKQVDFLDENIEYSLCTTYSVDDIEFKGNKEGLKFIEYSHEDLILGKKYQTRTCTILFRNVCSYIIGVKTKYNFVNSIDTFLKIILTENEKKLAVLPFVGAYYRRHNGGVWSSLSTIDLLKSKAQNNNVFVKYCVDNKKYYLAFVLAYRVVRDRVKLGILKLIGK